MPSIAKSFSIVLLVGFSAVLAAPTATKADVRVLKAKGPCVNDDISILGVATTLLKNNISLDGWSKEAVEACRKTETQEDVDKALTLCPELKTLSTCAAPGDLVKNCYTKSITSSPVDKPSNKPVIGTIVPNDSIVAGISKTPGVVPSGDKGKDAGGKQCGKDDKGCPVQVPDASGIQPSVGGKPTNGGTNPVQINGGANVQVPGNSGPSKSGGDVQVPSNGTPGKDNGGKGSGKDNGPGVGGGKGSGKPVSSGDCSCASKDLLAVSGVF